MSEQLLTKCPHCATTFRLNQEQLEIAGGAVRCGACYQVFHASEHIVKKAVVEEIASPAQESPDPFQEFENTPEPEPTAESDPYATNDWNLDNHPDADLFTENYQEKLDEPENELENLGYGGDKPKKADGGEDEAWAEKLLEELGDDAADDQEETPGLIQDDPEEDNEHHSNTGFSGITSSDGTFDEELNALDGESQGSELSNSFNELDDWGSEDPFAINENEDDTPISGSGAVDESWAKAMLNELEQDNNPEPNLENLEIMGDVPEEEDGPFAAKNLSNDIPAVKKPKSKPKADAKAKKTSTPEDTGETKDDRSFESEDFFSQLSPEHDIDDIELGAMPELLEDDEPLHDNLTPDSQDIMEHQIAASAAHFGIEEEAPKRSLVKTAALVLINIFAALALCGQYLYFQYDNLARNETYRPMFKIFCEKAGCELPLTSDVSQIRGTNLVVRSHALERNALVIDAIVYNRAAFSQPFPVIELRFDDINGSAVASRRFLPSEYIHDNRIDLNNMPSDTPVHLTLEIVDPGLNAVNYQMNFYAAG
ncbi:hypothetical protein A9Q81_21860 [Gammaproteobacteria bacterium 42_54_T18]|nr:hypothetical protein A9Q81_21860 [Gammaproteobacteria bacterium 42_54_T18]